MSHTDRATVTVNQQVVTITAETEVVTILDNQREDITASVGYLLTVGSSGSFRAQDKSDALGDLVEGVLKITGTDTIDTSVSGTTVSVDVIDSALSIAASQLTSGSLSIDLIPSADRTYNIGNEDYRWNQIHADIDGAILFRAKNASGGVLSVGDVVYISGSTGAETPDVDLADANDAAKMPAFGVISIGGNDGAEVHVTTFGSVLNVDLPSATYTVGDEVFVSTTAGEFTKTAPTGESSALQKIGYVTRVNPGGGPGGTLKVMGAGRTNAVPNLNDGNIFIGNASNQAITAPLSNYAVSSVTGGSQIGVLTIGGVATVNHQGPGSIATSIIEPASISIDSNGHVVNIGVSKISLEASQNLGDLPDAAAARTNLGLEIGTDVAAASHTHEADDITNGIFSILRIPNLPASKITSGVIGDAYISSSSVTQHAGDIDLLDLGNVTGTIFGTGSGIYYNGTNWVAGILTAGQIPTLTLSKISDAGTAAASDTTDFAAASHTHTVANITDLSDPVTSPSMTGVSAGSITGVIKCSQAQYDAITPVSTVLYVIV